MINLIWIVLFLIGIIYGIGSNRGIEINEVILSSPKKAFDIMITLFCSIVFWSGILNVAKEGGFLSFITKIMNFILKPLFKNIPKNHPSMDYISGNITANMLGLGSAATPMGLKAMEALSELNEYKKEASKEMITLLVLNTSGVTLIPSSLLAIRQSFGAIINFELIPQIIFASLSTAIIALLIDYLFRRIYK